LIDVDGDLFGASLGGNVLRLGELGAPAVTTETDQILGDDRHRPSRALFPGRVGRRVDDNLPDDSPTGVMRVAPRDQEPRQRIGHALGFGLGPVDVKMPQRGTDVSAVVDRPGQLPCGLRSLSFRVDPFTVAAPSTASGGCRDENAHAVRAVSSELWSPLR
jgi:hypothetical protein